MVKPGVLRFWHAWGMHKKRVHSHNTASTRSIERSAHFTNTLENSGGALFLSTKAFGI